MRYVIMANGEARRWGNYLGRPKHLVETGDGEPLIARTSRIVREVDAGAEVIISAHDERYAVPGARLFTPRVRELEIDRFAPELLDRPCCYLYGDTYYTLAAMRRICGTRDSGDLLCFGNRERVFSIKVMQPGVVRTELEYLRREIEAGRMPDCKGWQLYHHMRGMPLSGHATGEGYIFIDDETTDFNTPAEYEAFMKRKRRG